MTTTEQLAEIVVLWAERGDEPDEVAAKLQDCGHDTDAVQAAMVRATEIIAEKQSALMAHLARRQLGWD